MQPFTKTNQNKIVEDIPADNDEVQSLGQSLPRITFFGITELVKYQGFWYFDGPAFPFKSILDFQGHFRARNTDLILASFPKTGATWMKSLLFCVANRDKYPLNESPLCTKLPHELVYFLEMDVYGKPSEYPQPQDVDELPSPRLLSTHMPYTSLPKFIKDSACKVIYIARNPMDTFVSSWNFFSNRVDIKESEEYKMPRMEEYFEQFMEGNVVFGPFFEHLLEYWEQSLEQEGRVLFIKYEDLKDDPIFFLKKLAEFISMPFTTEEENEGVIKEIIEFCSISKMKELECNKSGTYNGVVERKSFFRKGKVGGWTECLTPEMVQRMEVLMKHKFEGTGLSFKLEAS